ncbi:Fermitin family-like protein 2 [Nibea albiflora]|uniref:Fermitin family-like protein 2 n=1 Tax=Nibea albiflora TaxID=240163 RepID=A0ACB7FFR1_NIBAL|nr:Fermitin family-like protein 2 [Nibea albiflora]
MALDGIRMPDGCYADGTWELKMHVTDLHRDVSLRVTGEIHIGGVMLKLVEKLGRHASRCTLAEAVCLKRADVRRPPVRRPAFSSVVFACVSTRERGECAAVPVGVSGSTCIPRPSFNSSCGAAGPPVHIAGSNGLR